MHVATIVRMALFCKYDREKLVMTSQSTVRSFIQTLQHSAISRVCQENVIDQPAHQSSLISVYIMLLLKSILYTYNQRNVKFISSLCSCTGLFESDFFSPEGRFYRVEAQLYSRIDRVFRCKQMFPPTSYLFVVTLRIRSLSSNSNHFSQSSL